MKARWIQDIPVTAPTIGMNLVAGFWPWNHFFVSTSQADTNTPLDKLTKAIGRKEPAPFHTLISRCYRNMILKEDKQGNSVIYCREYSSLQEAQKGHSEIIRGFRTGTMDLMEHKIESIKF